LFNSCLADCAKLVDGVTLAAKVASC